MKLHSPLRVPQSQSKDFILNLNRYRNTHYRTLNNVKKTYKELMQAQIELLPEYDRVELGYVLYPKTHALTDVANVCAVHDKFFSDALVELGKLPDDNYRYLKKVIYVFGSVCPENPRVDIYINPLEREKK